MVRKTTSKRLRLNPNFNKTIDTNLNVWSHDENSYEFRFEFYDDECDIPIDLTDAKGRILLLFKNEGDKKHLLDLEIEDETLGLAKFIVPKRTLGYEGIVNAHIYIDFEGKTHDFGNFLFRMKRSAIDENFPQLDTVYVSEFEKALEEMNEILHEFDDFETDVNERLGNITTNIDETETNVLTKLDELDKKIDDKDVAKQSDIDNIVNGELNLLRGTKRFSAPWRLVKGVPIKDSDGLYYFRLKDTYTEWAYIPYDEWEKGEEYIFSCHARSEKDVAFNPKIEVTGSPLWVIPVTSREFKRYEVKFVVDFDNKNGALQLLTRQNTAYVDIKKVKLEKANKSIGWQPHSSEMVDNIDIESLQKQINELKNAILNQGGTM